jgi:hypothetical protein
MLSGIAKVIGWLVLLMIAVALLAGKAFAQPPTYLPWQPGVTHTVIQGNNGGYSHNTQYTRYGWDFDLSYGTAVLSAAPGTVHIASYGYNTGWGNTVTVCYGDGTCSRYGHLSSISVSPGQGVGQAQLIGYSGSTGNSSGPHLHYQLENGGGVSLPSSFAEAGVPGEGQRVTSANNDDPSPQFTDVHVYSSQTITVAAGDQAKVAVTALYQGPHSIPCGYANFGMREGSARFADYRAGYWPASPWRGPNRVAAVGCSGNLDPGEHIEWDLTYYVPPDTQGGTYLTGTYSPVYESVAWSHLTVPISIHVLSQYQAAFAGQSVTPLVGPGETGHVTVALKNTGKAAWHNDGPYPVRLGTKDDAAFPLADASWTASRDRLSLAEPEVKPGEVGHFSGTFAAPADSKPLRIKQFFAPLVEGKEWFGQDIGIYEMFYVGDKQHQPYTVDDYQAAYAGQVNVGHPLQTGDTAEATMTWRNTGSAVWFADGPFPVRLRGIRPKDRGSGFVDTTDPRTVGAAGIRLPVDKVEPGETVTFTLPVKVAEQVVPGDYKEYFRPVAEGSTWFGRDDAWWPFTVTAKQDDGSSGGSAGNPGGPGDQGGSDPTDDNPDDGTGPDQPDDYAAADYRAELVTPAKPKRLHRGQTAVVKTVLRNTGPADLFADGDQRVTLRLVRPDHSSYFLDPTSDKVIGQRAVTLDQDEVHQGDRFSFTIPLRVKKGIRTGLYREHYRLSADSVTLFGPNDIRLSIRVK